MRAAALSLVPLALAGAGLAPPAKHAFGFDAAALAAAEYVTQPQDHFDEGNANKWQQAYYVNRDHWDGSPDAPVFVYIGGEGPIYSNRVTSNFVTDVLGKYKGLMFALEHRYYGCHNASACPYDFANPEPNHMQFCTAKQALADMASFHTIAAKEYGVPASAKWVAIGGSYPGMLAGFVRALYPDKYHLAVASSAPITGVLDMTSFQNVVSDAYTMGVEGVAGSQECRDQIEAGHRAISADLKTAEGRQRLAFLFNHTVPSAEWLTDPTNARVFAGCGVAAFPAQANEPTCVGEACGISQICAVMTTKDELTPTERLARVASLQSEGGLRMTHNCEMDWEDAGDIPAADVNYWGYQTCNEFGFYQTCDSKSDCFYAKGLISFDAADGGHHPDAFCQSQFGISTEETVSRIKETNQYYTEHLANATRIVWVNGDVDPWHRQSVLQAPSAQQPVIYPVRGAAHCAWMSAEAESDQTSLKEARVSIWQQVDAWLKEN